MKLKLLLLPWLLWAGLAASAQSKQGDSQPVTSYAQLMKLAQPPGVVLVQDSLWMDETEVANIHWLEYLHFLREDSSEVQYQRARPDTAVWEKLGFNDPYLSYYLRYPGFRYYPVVGISYEQAVQYCRWRSAKVNENLHSAAYLKKHPQLRGYEFRVEYRLPTVREWELAAGGKAVAEQPYGDVFPPAVGSRRYQQQVVSQKKPATNWSDCPPVQDARQAGKPLFHVPFNVRERLYIHDIRQAFNCPGMAGVTLNKQTGFYDWTILTESLFTNPPNPRGCYNMLGNAAELTATPGLAKGGSFWHSVKEAAVQASLPYAGPQAWLGFRCACTVYIEPKK